METKREKKTTQKIIKTSKIINNLFKKYDPTTPTKKQV